MLIVICLLSCKQNKRRDDAVKIVYEWTGKEIKFPKNAPCYMSGEETLPELCNDCFKKEYKILLYVDSTGCSDCRLNLFEWRQLMTETDSLFFEKVSFLFYFQPKSVKEISTLFLQYQFEHPVLIDINDEINHMNHFPQAIQYQCFLLDIDNKVLAIGNPVLNMKIWNLYKSHISKEKKNEMIISTSAVDKDVYNNVNKSQKNLTLICTTIK